MIALALALPGWLPAPRALAPRVAVPRHRLLRMDGEQPVVDKQLSSTELITYAEQSEEFKGLMDTALARLDRNRLINGKPKYESVDGMIEAYIDEAGKAGLGWTQEEAESEVVRYLRRQALADEGGEKSPDTALIFIFGILVTFAASTGFAPMQSLPANVVSPFW